MRGLLFASAVIALVAVSAPGLFTRYLGAPSSGGSSRTYAEARESSTEARQAAGRVYEVEAARDGHFYVDADINFRPVRLMVDTGATVVALRESDAMSAGIRIHASEFRHPVQTANGTTNAAEAMLDSVTVEDIEVRNVRALVLPDDQLAISLLGGSFLHGLERFEVSGGSLILEE
jgi:aspartyl protease family protein